MSKHLNQERLANHSTFLFSRVVVVQWSAELALDQEALGLRPAATKLFPGEPVNSQICLVIAHSEKWRIKRNSLISATLKGVISTVLDLKKIQWNSNSFSSHD